MQNQTAVCICCFSMAMKMKVMIWHVVCSFNGKTRTRKQGLWRRFLGSCFLKVEDYCFAFNDNLAVVNDNIDVSLCGII